MNHTQTAFGARLLRKWLQQPLLEKKYGLPRPLRNLARNVTFPADVAKTCTRFIDERLDAVEELMETSAPAIKVPGLTLP